MKPLYPDLWISTPEFPAEDNDIMMHGFMLRHPRGNLLFGRIENPDDHNVIELEGGAIRHYFTHWHEAGPGAALIQQRFNSALYCHSRSLSAVMTSVEPDETLTHDELHFGDLQMLSTPGHTPGSTSYFYASPHGKKYLFVGDTLTRDHERWVTVQVPDSNRADLERSLQRFRKLRPDVILMSTTRGHLSWQEVTLMEWLDAIDEAEQSPVVVRESSLYLPRH